MHLHKLVFSCASLDEQFLFSTHPLQERLSWATTYTAAAQRMCCPGSDLQNPRNGPHSRVALNVDNGNHAGGCVEVTTRPACNIAALPQACVLDCTAVTWKTLRSVRARYSMHLCKAVAVCSHCVRLRNALAVINGIWVHFNCYVHISPCLC